jgi:adenylate cyclase
MALIDTYEQASMFEALRLLERAIGLDPVYARAMSLAAYAHAQVVVSGWADDPERHQRLAVELATRAVQIAGDDADVLSWVTGAYLPLDEDIETSIALIDRSLALNPGCAQAWLMSGFLRAALGEGERAIEHFEKSMRLDPCSSDRGHQLTGIALAKFNLGLFREAARLLKEANQLQPAVSINLALLAACHGHLRQADGAQAAIAKYRRLSSVDIRKRTSLFKRDKHRNLFLAGIDLAEGAGKESGAVST